VRQAVDKGLQPLVPATIVSRPPGAQYMTLDTRVPEVSFAIETVRRAGQLARRIRTDMAMLKLTKSDMSPVTVADFAVQACVSHDLEEAFPEDALVAEERSSELRVSERAMEAVTRFVGECVSGAGAEEVRRWVDRGAGETAGRFWSLDPIDGTKGYLRGGQYAVALALVQGGAVQLGVLGCPGLHGTCKPGARGGGVIVAAVRGHGTWAMPLDGVAELARLHVSDCRVPASARLLRSHEAGHTNVAQVEAFVCTVGIQAPPVLMDSQAKYAVLSSGHAEVLLRLLSPDALDYKEKIWDQAAGALVIEEAGGRVTDLDGENLDFSAGRALIHNRGLVASNGRLHEAVLEALARVEKPPENPSDWD